MPPVDSCKITLGVRSVECLLDVEGSPLVLPRVHPDVAHWIFEEASELPRHATPEIEISVPSADLGKQKEVEQAVHSHFQFQARDAGIDLRETLNKGWLSLLVALLLVLALILFGEFMERFGDGRLNVLLRESLVIIGWVTLWHPMETLIFQHFPIRKKRNISQKLSRAPVRLVATQSQ